MEAMSNLENLKLALDRRFEGSEGLEELEDISRHGLSGGVAGFIYYNELNQFFAEHEAAIEETLQNMGVTLQMLSQNAPDGTFQTIRQNTVWLVVEEYAHLRVNQDLDEPEENEPTDQALDRESMTALDINKEGFFGVLEACHARLLAIKKADEKRHQMDADIPVQYTDHLDSVLMPALEAVIYDEPTDAEMRSAFGTKWHDGL